MTEPAPLPGEIPGAPPAPIEPPDQPDQPMARPRRRVRDVVRGAPLSVKLPAIICLLLILGLALFGFGASFALSSYLTQQVDESLRAQVLQLADRDGTGLGQPQSPRGPTDYAQGIVEDSAATSPVVWQLPPSMSEDAAPDLSATEIAVHASYAMQPLHAYTATSQDGSTQWRAMSVRARFVATGTMGTVTIATPMTGIFTTLARMRLVIVWAAIPIVVAASLIGYLLVRRSLRPLKQVEATAAAIAAGDLTQRVPPAPRGTEVGELTESLNGMLTQIEQAFEVKAASESRMRQFVSDASHELRTPLASVRGYGELYRMGALPDEEKVSEAMRRIEQEARRMGSLVEDLLQLARLDEGRALRRTDVDLTHVALDAAADAHAQAPGRVIKVLDANEHPLGADDAVHVVGDEDRLRQIVSNLLTNACHYTPEDTGIEVLVSRTAQAALLQVRDHGPGIPPEMAARVFERFYRMDASRTRTTAGGSGLGLAIVASLVGAHNGGVDIIETPGGGATFRVTLPLSPTDQVRPDAGPGAEPEATPARVVPA